MTAPYLFTLTGPVDHPNTSNPDDIVSMAFGVTATDSDGDTANGTITVQIHDDAPIAVADFSHFDATAVSTTGNVTSNDYLSKDGHNTVTTVDFNGHDTAISAGGTNIAGTYGTLHISANGSVHLHAERRPDDPELLRAAAPPATASPTR